MNDGCSFYMTFLFWGLMGIQISFPSCWSLHLIRESPYFLHFLSGLAHSLPCCRSLSLSLSEFFSPTLHCQFGFCLLKPLWYFSVNMTPMDALPDAIVQFILSHISNAKGVYTCNCISKWGKESIPFIRSLYFRRGIFYDKIWLTATRSLGEWFLDPNGFFYDY